MARLADDVLRAAVQLPERERVRVVEKLLLSLESERDQDVDAAWAAEVERRSQEIKRGKVRPIPWLTSIFTGISSGNDISAVPRRRYSQSFQNTA